MNSDSDNATDWSRRGVLVAALATTHLGGCLATENIGAESSVTTPGAESPSFTEPLTPSPSDAETPTPSPSDTETPTPEPTVVTNESEYPADQPLKPKSVSDSYSQWFGYDEPLLLGPDDVLPQNNGAVRPIRSRENWRKTVTNATEQEDVDPFAYEFVDETGFETETIVVVQHAVFGGEWLRLLSVDGVGSPHVRLQVEQAGQGGFNSFFYAYVFLRLPTDGTEIEQITAAVDDGQRSGRYVYRDE
jgi:hypothetical protein